MASLNKICLFFLCILFLASGWSCNIINPAEPIPAYIEIDSASLKITADSQGTSSQKITDAWTYVNINSVGVYEIPKTFPVLSSGSTHIIISAGILNNGADNTKVIYPFYYPDTVTLNLQPKKVYKINPVFQYRAPTRFLLNENFENGTRFEKLSGDTVMTYSLNRDSVFEGKRSAKISLDLTHAKCECITQDAYTFPGDGSPVYIEMNYKCDMVFQAGLEYTTGSGAASIYEWTINPHSSGWNKIYLNLTDIIQSLGGGTFGILILADKSAAPGEGYVLLDNIKLLTI